jgi:hypothetical protein
MLPEYVLNEHPLPMYYFKNLSRLLCGGGNMHESQTCFLPDIRQGQQMTYNRFISTIKSAKFEFLLYIIEKMFYH